MSAVFRIVRGGMLVAAGQDAEKLRAAFDQFRRNDCRRAGARNGRAQAASRRQGPSSEKSRSRAIRGIVSPAREHRPVTCGFQGTDFILGVGDGSVEEILKRRQQEPPAWLVNVRKQLPVERVSTVVYLNLKMLLDQVTADKAMPKTREALRRLGLDKLSALSSVSGLEGETFTSKLLLATDGEPQGPLLNLFSDQPLRAGDLTPIPRDATLALAMRFDAQKAVDQFAAMVEKLGAGPADGSRRPVGRPHEVAASRSPPRIAQGPGRHLLRLQFARRRGPGGAGPHGRVPIRNRDAWSVIQAKFLGSSLAKGFQERVHRIATRVVQSGNFTRVSFAGQRIFYFTGMGFAPGLVRHGPRADRRHDAAERHGLSPARPRAQVAGRRPQVGRLIEGADGPSMLVDVDTAKLFELVYPFVPLRRVIGHGLFGGGTTPAAGRDSFGPGDPPAPGAGHRGPSPHEAGAGVDQPATVAGHGIALDGRRRAARSAVVGAAGCGRGATADRDQSFCGHTAVPCAGGHAPTASSPASRQPPRPLHLRAAPACRRRAYARPPPYTPCADAGGFRRSSAARDRTCSRLRCPGRLLRLAARAGAILQYPLSAPPGVSRLLSIGRE